MERTPVHEESMDLTEFRRERFGNLFVLLLAIGVSLVFYGMIRRLAVALLLAAIFAGMFHPMFRKLSGWLGGRRVLAALATTAARSGPAGSPSAPAPPTRAATCTGATAPGGASVAGLFYMNILITSAYGGPTDPDIIIIIHFI